MSLIQRQSVEDAHQLMGLCKLELPCMVNIGCVESNYFVWFSKVKEEITNLTKAFVPIKQKMFKKLYLGKWGLPGTVPSIQL